jgi:predicted aspartyl protease
MTKCIMFFILGVLAFNLHAQKKLPVIRATSEKVSINDDGFFEKDSWYLSPEAKPDVYKAYRSKKTKWVTFYTDIDSIKFKVKPGQHYDFIILLNEKDSCFTRIESYVPTSQFTSTKNDTIPFQLSGHNALVVDAVVNGKDSLKIHFDLGTFDFRLTKEGRSKVSQAKINTIQIGKIIWNNANVTNAKNASHGMDGRFGWHTFENKILTINNENLVLIVGDKLPDNLKEYQKMDLVFIKSWPCIEAIVHSDDKKHRSYFLMDNGSELAMVLNKKWIQKNELSTNLQVIKESKISDGAGNQYETKTVMIPKISVGGFEVENIQTLIMEGDGPMGEMVNYFGNNVLKRFDIILDFKKDKVYIKPTI